MKNMHSKLPAPELLERRRFLGLLGSSAGMMMVGGLGACGGSSSAKDSAAVTADSSASGSSSSASSTNSDPIWGDSGPVASILAALQGVSQSSFRAVDYLVTSYGAQTCTVVAQANPYTQTQSTNADKTNAAGAFDCRPAFLAAIAACSTEGGGRVLVPAGNWYCAGPIVLKSNVNFHLAANCTIYFSPNPADYATDGPYDCGTNGKLYYSRVGCNDLLNFGCPVYAFAQNNIALTGEDPATSILNGQAMTPFSGTGSTAICWWTYAAKSGKYGCTNTAAYTEDANHNLPAMSEAGIPATQRIFGQGHFQRPCMVEFFSCTNVLMENYQTNNTPNWQMHPVDCQNVVIRNVIVDSSGPNNDGFDPDACDTVLCDGMVFNTGDDCIAIKSGKNLDTQYGPATRHVIQNCVMNSGHGGVTLGSEMSAGIENIYCRNLNMLNANWATDPLSIAIRIKTNMSRGGYVKNVYINGVQVRNGVNLAGSSSAGTASSPKVITGSPINPSVPLGVVVAGGNACPSNNQGGIITFDCDYSATSDTLRTRPPQVSNFNISNVHAGNITKSGTTASCFQAIVAQGPVKEDYNGSGTPTVYPISGVTISDCDFGTPVCTGPASSTVAGPIYAFNVDAMVLKNVVIAGTTYNTTVTDTR
jgi:polygalacturonase